MSNLWVFGCSFSANFEYWVNQDGPNHFMRLKELRGGEMFPLWSELLAKELNLNLIIKANGGASNSQIFEKICDSCADFTRGDVVIIEWTFLERFRLGADFDGLKNIRAQDREGLEYWGEDVVDGIFYNRTKYPKAWANEVYEWMKIIDYLSTLVGFSVYYWSADDTIINSEDEEFRKQDKFILGLECTKSMMTHLSLYGATTIHEETNGLIIDSHYGEKGNRVMFNKFYDYLRDRV